MSDTVNVVKVRNGNICTLYVNGVLDYSTMEPFVVEVQGIEEEVRKVKVNFEGLEFIDSTGIGAIINLVHEANAKQFEIELDGLSDEIKELFETIGVFRIIETLLWEGEKLV